MLYSMITTVAIVIGVLAAMVIAIAALSLHARKHNGKYTIKFELFGAKFAGEFCPDDDQKNVNDREH